MVHFGFFWMTLGPIWSPFGPFWSTFSSFGPISAPNRCQSGAGTPGVPSARRYRAACRKVRRDRFYEPTLRVGKSSATGLTYHCARRTGTGQRVGKSGATGLTYPCKHVGKSGATGLTYQCARKAGPGLRVGKPGATGFTYRRCVSESPARPVYQCANWHRAACRKIRRAALCQFAHW